MAWGQVRVWGSGFFRDKERGRIVRCFQVSLCLPDCWYFARVERNTDVLV